MLIINGLLVFGVNFCFFTCNSSMYVVKGLWQTFFFFSGKYVVL